MNKNMPFASQNINNRLPKTLVQSNLITMSKQSWTLLEKKVLYVIVSQLRECQKLNKEIDVSSDLFLKFDGDFLFEADKNITRACETLKGLREKSIEIRGDKKYIVVGFINYADYDLKTHQVKVQISHKILPYYFNLTQRFSQFALHTALACKSVYLQRLFEMCAMFSSHGLFSLSIEQIKALFCIEKGKYADSKKDLIRWVVKAPQEELFELYNQKRSSLFFTFFEKDSHITFLIHQRSEPGRSANCQAEMIAVLLKNILGYSQPIIDAVLIKYSSMDSATNFSGLFREMAMVKIHVKSKAQQRAKIAQILYAHCIHPNQNNTLF